MAAGASVIVGQDFNNIITMHCCGRYRVAIGTFIRSMGVVLYAKLSSARRGAVARGASKIVRRKRKRSFGIAM